MRKYIYKKRQIGIDTYEIICYITNDGINYYFNGIIFDDNVDYQNYINEGNIVELLEPVFPNINDLKTNKLKELEERYEDLIINHIISGRKLTYRTQINAIDGVYGNEFLTQYRLIRDNYRNEYHQKEAIINALTFDDKNINEKFELIARLNELCIFCDKY